MVSQIKSSNKKSTSNLVLTKNKKEKTKKLALKKMISLGTDILKKKKSKILVSDFVVHDDPTHMVGYKKMNLQKKFGKTAGKENRAQNYAALSKLSPADDIRRKESPQRRLQYPSK